MFYAGDADVAGGKSAETIAADTATLLALIHKMLPGARVVVIGTKPSPLHWKHQDTIRKANAQIQATIESDPLAAFADVEAALLGTDGQPAPGFLRGQWSQPERRRLPGVDGCGAAGDRAGAPALARVFVAAPWSRPTKIT